jgi:transglutaminase-like putative cysteine protease
VAAASLDARVPARAASRPLLPVAAARALAFGPLAAFGAVAWAGMLVPAEPARGLICVAACLAAVPLLRAVGRLAGRARFAALCALAVAGFAGVLLAAGVPARFLLPGQWDALAAGLGQGLTTLPGVSVPYRGVDDWVIWTLEAGGGLLIGAAAFAAFGGQRGERRLRAMVAGGLLTTLYAVPVIEHGPGRPLLSGAVFAALAAAFLWLELVDRHHAPAALLVVAAAVAAGVVAGPRLDAGGPWLDYEALAQDLTPASATRFSWDHGYGPLDWPRDGREILRVKAGRSAYWKAVALDRFDGLRWRHRRAPASDTTDAELAPRRPAWHEQIRVSVRNVTSRQFIGAGTTEAITDSPRNFVTTAPGEFATLRRPLRKGHSYRARVYVPRPTASQLAAAGHDYPRFALSALIMELPPAVGGPPPLSILNPDDQPSTQILFTPWGGGDAAAVLQPGGIARRDGADVLSRSRYHRTYALARSLAARSRDPYDFVRRVQRRVRDGALYTERPARSSLPLETFLFDRREGYCQQFSGAMALLLRMGGVPARVASGFAPGSLDRERGEFVVRDIDAHSWVEAYFPRIGWVTFDPTPAVAPPRAQQTGASGGSGDEGDLAGLGDRSAEASGRGQAARARGAGGVDRRLLAGGLALLAALAAGAAVLTRRGRPAVLDPDPRLHELQVALHRARGGAPPATTLAALEQSLAAAPAAGPYLQALRGARFGGGAQRPTGEQRAALRRALGTGRGWRGRLRAWWALPPRLLD